MVTIACVLKSGGDYTVGYVDALWKAVVKNSAYPINLVCLSNIKGEHQDIALKDNLPGWWSKIELFKLKGPVVYLDLDTVIVGSIDPLIELACLCGEDEFFMLRALNPKRKRASGVMIWNGDWSWIHSEFKDKYIERIRWDQKYIELKLARREIKAKSIQDYITGIYSYKLHCKPKPPEDARIILFHGRPRPHEVNWLGWVKRNWAS